MNCCLRGRVNSDKLTSIMQTGVCVCECVYLPYGKHIYSYLNQKKKIHYRRK